MAIKKQHAPEKGEGGAPEKEKPEVTPDSPVLDLLDVAVHKMIKQAKNRGYVTSELFNSVMLSEEVTSEQIEDILTMLNEMGINLVETEATEPDEEEQREEPEEEEESEGGEIVEVKRPAPAKVERSEPSERTADPVRLYLREMGSIELLSRQGEIAIAKRIEAGREAMIGGLCESPLTFQAIIIWRDELNEGKVFLRDIIDLEATYAGPDAKAMPAPVGPDGQPIAGIPIPGQQKASRRKRWRRRPRPPIPRHSRSCAPAKKTPTARRSRKAQPKATTTMTWRARSRLPRWKPSSSPRCSKPSTRSRANTSGCAACRSRTSEQAQEPVALAGAGAQVQEAQGRDHRRGQVAPPEPGAHRFAGRAALRHQQAPGRPTRAA